MPRTGTPGSAPAQRFRSAAPREVTDEPATAADYLERYVNDRAGPRPAAQWFERGARGTGVGLRGIGLPGGLESRTLPSAAFPPLGLADLGHDEPHCRLVADCLAWQAPWLLTLGHLDRATRARLEVQARTQALAVQAHHRLYPELAEEGTIRAALVAAWRRGLRPVAIVRGIECRTPSSGPALSKSGRAKSPARATLAEATAVTVQGCSRRQWPMLAISS